MRNESNTKSDPTGLLEVRWNGTWHFQGGSAVIAGIAVGGSFTFIGHDKAGNTYSLEGKGKGRGETGGLCVGYYNISFQVTDFAVDTGGVYANGAKKGLSTSPIHDGEPASALLYGLGGPFKWPVSVSSGKSDFGPFESNSIWGNLGAGGGGFSWFFGLYFVDFDAYDVHYAIARKN